jgi:glycosyltransferase involved in cell wall biosynthesis
MPDASPASVAELIFIDDPSLPMWRWAWSELPARALKARGVNVQRLSVSEADRAMFPPGAVIVTTLAVPRALIERLFGLRHVRTLAVVADDLWAPQERQGRELGIDPQTLQGGLRIVQGWVARATAVAVTATPLLRIVHRVHRRVVLVPWAAPPEREWPTPACRLGQGVRIGWAGLPPGRDLDFAIVRPALRRLVGERPDLRVVFWGTRPSWSAELGDQVEYRPGERIEAPAWFTRLAALKLDVALAPVARTRLNGSRSRAKFIDATVGAGCPLVASDFGPYRELTDAGAPLLTVPDDPEYWYEAIAGLFNSSERRAELVAAARTWVAKHATIETVADDWLRAIEAAAE